MLFILHVICSCISHAYVLSFSYIWYIWSAWDFSDCSSLLFPLNLFTLVVSMAPKRKSTPARNPLCSGVSYSTDPSPSNVWFRDDDAFKAFSENFFRQGIHSERQVVLSDFVDTNLPSVNHSRGWESLCDVLVTCPLVLIQEFYSNMHEIDHSVPLFFTRVRGTRIPVTPQLVADVLRVPRIEFPDYSSCERLRLCLGMSSCLLSMSALLLRVNVSLHHVDLLLKVLDSWICWWLLFCIHSLTITPS